MNAGRCVPLAGVNIVDLSSGIAGGYATKLLTELGADVVRLEPPGGCALRRWSASTAPPPGDDGLLFRFLAAGQSSRVVDPEDAADRRAALTDAADADLIVWSPGSSLADDDELQPRALRAAAADAVVVAITPFGLDGPWSDRPATEFTVQALAGGVAHRGPAPDPPLAIGGQHGEWVAGTFAAVGALVGLRRRALTGHGELVDVSMLEALIMTPHFNAITYQSIAGAPYFEGRRPTYPGDIEPTADGYVGFALVNSLQHWLDFCVMIGKPEWNDERDLHNPVLRAGRYDELTADIRAWTTARTTHEIVEVAAMFRVPAVAVGHGANVATTDHFVERHFVQRSALGDFVQPSPPVRFGGELPAETAHPAPLLGPRLATSPSTHGGRARPVASGADAPLPMAGVRILDLTAYWAGPFATHLPAMLGAEVIHVESPARIDGARTIVVRNAPAEHTWEWSHAFQGVNTNKDGIAVDLTTDAGRDLVSRLIERCDAVVENYSPRVLENWGFTAERLAALRPDLIVLRMPAFGLAGPWRDRTGFAMTMEQASGMAWVTGRADGEPVTLLGPCDPVGGAHGTIALLAALAHRDRTGEGGLVELPMVAAPLNMAAEQVITYTATGERLGRDGNRGPAAAPQNLYRTCDPPDPAGETRWVALAVATDAQWAALRTAVGDPVWAAEASLATAVERQRAHDKIDAELAAWCATRTMDSIVDRLCAAGVPAAPVLNTGELADLPPLATRPFLEWVEHPVTGRSLHTTYPIRFEHGPTRWHRRAAPTLGHDNRAVLRRVAGLDDAAIDQLEREGVIGAQRR